MKSGDNGEEDPPVPIPNTEVKLFSAEDTWRETAWENRSLPVLEKSSSRKWTAFFMKGKSGCPKRDSEGSFASAVCM